MVIDIGLLTIHLMRKEDCDRNENTYKYHDAKRGFELIFSNIKKLTWIPENDGFPEEVKIFI